jgi:hypothetical protein
MDTAMTSAPQPLKAWDAQTKENWPLPGPRSATETFNTWLRTHSVEPKDTIRVEYYLIDCPFIRIYQYERDASGHRYVDPAIGDAARRQPFDVPITTLPPEESQ